MTSFEDRVVADVTIMVYMRSLEWTVIQYDRYLYKEGKCGHRGTHIEITPCDDEGIDWGDVSISQGMLKIASKPPEARGESWNTFFLTALRRNQPIP